MRDLGTLAIVLEKKAVGEADVALTLYTELLGKVIARGRSMRKIVSKLAAHTEPGHLSEVRLVERNAAPQSEQFFLVDAISEIRLFEDIGFLELAARVTFPLQRDHGVWEFLYVGKADRAKLFSLVGIGAPGSSCALCALNPPAFFFEPDQNFICLRCSLEMPQTTLTYI